MLLLYLVKISLLLGLGYAGRQGVWNADDGFLLTDPVIHTGDGRRPTGRRPGGGRGSNGKTDKGAAGIRLFFASHACNALCRRLALRPVASDAGPGAGAGQRQGRRSHRESAPPADATVGAV